MSALKFISLVNLLCSAQLSLIYSQLSRGENNSIFCKKCDCQSDLLLGTRAKCKDTPITDPLLFSKSSETERIQRLELSYINIPHFNFRRLENFTRLQSLSINHCNIKTIHFNSERTNFPYLSDLNLGDNQLENISAVLHLAEFLPQLKLLNLSGNALNCHSDFNCGFKLSAGRVKYLDVSRNQLASLPSLPQSLRFLNFSYNQLTSIQSRFPPTLHSLDLSFNNLNSVTNDTFPELATLTLLNISGNSLQYLDSQLLATLSALTRLDISRNPIRKHGNFPAQYALERLNFGFTDIEYFNTSQFRELRGLKHLDISGNYKLESLIGQAGDLRKIQTLSLSNSAFRALPLDFFLVFPRLQSLDTSSNPWACDCRLLWLSRAPQRILRQIVAQNSSFCSVPQFLANSPIGSVNPGNLTDCHLGMPADTEQPFVVREKYGSEVKLRCDHFGDPPAWVTWDRTYPSVHIGSWDADSGTVQQAHGEPETYEILPGGTLKLHYVSRETVGPYTCIVNNTHGNVNATTIFRLDVNWDEMKIYSIFCGIGTALGFFALNVIWAGIRSIVLWKINRMEQNSRIRKMLEAMEKYRQRQADGLHEKYTSKMNAIRDNYHMQAEQLWRSYAAQVERFRDYKAQQMGAVSSHVEAARESYAAQMGRMREYGAKQMERVYESYQRQMNRVRTFSLQQRLRLMRQYKIKHRYLNKLLEGLNMDYNRSSVDPPVAPEIMSLPRLEEEDGFPTASTFYVNEEDNVSVSTYHSLPSDHFSPSDIDTTGINQASSITLSPDYQETTC